MIKIKIRSRNEPGAPSMKPFFIVGPTATGKSEIAAEIASRLDAEIVNADAFQIYCGLDRLVAKPEAPILAKAPHHLLSVIPLTEEMNVEKFRAAAVKVIESIHARSRNVIVVGGSGLYVQALTHGLSRLPAADPKLRAQLSERSLDELRDQLVSVDAAAAKKIDLKNRRRVLRALEICLLTGKPVSEQRTRDAAAAARKEATPDGVFVFRDRAELYDRIDRRVERMFAEGVVEEVRALPELSSTAGKALGLREIRAFVAGEISQQECIARIQQGTRHYAKRQLTWFQRQTNFVPLNLSSLGYPKATELIVAQTSQAFRVVQKDD